MRYRVPLARTALLSEEVAKPPRLLNAGHFISWLQYTPTIDTRQVIFRGRASEEAGPCAAHSASHQTAPFPIYCLTVTGERGLIDARGGGKISKMPAPAA